MRAHSKRGVLALALQHSVLISIAAVHLRSLHAARVDPRPSPGCSNRDPNRTAGKLLRRNIRVSDQNFTNIERKYALHVPAHYNHSATPAPLLMYFHMQEESPDDASTTQFEALGDQHGFFTVYPAGHDAGGSADTSCGPAWNVGANGDQRVCTRQASSQYGCPSQNDGWTCTCCHSSCESLGFCDHQDSQCSWSACYSDIDFVDAILEHLGKEFCIDLAAQFVVGASNGGMMVHALAAAMPTTFAAVAPIYGLPLRHYLNVPSELRGVPILATHDRWDQIIPLRGGESNEGWIYASLAETMAAWANVNGCGTAPNSTVHAVTPFDGGGRVLACHEFAGCDTGRVVWCLFDGYHGDWPDPLYDELSLEELTWWFFNSTLHAS